MNKKWYRLCLFLGIAAFIVFTAIGYFLAASFLGEDESLLVRHGAPLLMGLVCSSGFWFFLPFTINFIFRFVDVLSGLRRGTINQANVKYFKLWTALLSFSLLLIAAARFYRGDSFHIFLLLLSAGLLIISLYKLGKDFK